MSYAKSFERGYTEVNFYLFKIVSVAADSPPSGRCSCSVRRISPHICCMCDMNNHKEPNFLVLSFAKGA